ncbi:MAG: J domain-containing protein [Deltaproteobacteria bacterium]|nr:J domain-containing protein [Deltaproteobacteria bacterium]
MAPSRTLHVRCTTWEQVETFHTRKLRRGKLLSMKVPFAATLGSSVTLGLELPNEVVIAIDGTVRKSSPIEGDTKTWIEVELHGFTDEVVARIRAMAAGVEPVPAEPDAPPERPSKVALASEQLPVDERQLFHHLTTELRRMRQAAVHEVLGVERDADADQIRLGWMTLVRKLHPDLVARRKAPAITHLAEELTILVNRAYDRLRAALVAEGRANVVGSVVRPPPGWLVGFDDLASGAGSDPARRRAQKAVVTIPPVNEAAPSAVGAQGSGGQGGEAFETRARTMLQEGDPDTAQEVLAAALVVYPRSKPLRSLYYVASAVSALGKGEIMLATSQLEAALAHYEGCSEAARLLEHVRQHGQTDREALRRVFQ